MKKSYIWGIEKEKIQELIDNSSTMVEILKTLGFNAYSGNHRTLNARIKSDGLSLVKFKENKKIYLEKKRLGKEIPIQDIFTKNSTYHRNSLKIRLVRDGIKEYKCEKCGNLGEWHGEKLILQLEHKNGISNDNRIQNLCFLCPNCHSQTKTYSGRNKKITFLCGCGKEKCKTAKLCEECYRKKISQNLKLPNLKKEELEIMMKQMPIVKIAKIMGISDTGIRKYAVRMGIDYKTISKYSHKKDDNKSKI
jgi:Zn finger protein HypA/HybF involved in hydrogenase expression